MNPEFKCPECGTALPKDAVEGLCPKCLLGRAQTSIGAEPVSQGHTISEKTPDLSIRIEDLALLFPQLEILEVLGQGGMGVVYKARQVKLGRLVALKLLSSSVALRPGFAERFAREGRALAMLNHPGIVSIYDLGQAGELYYLIMEYVEGANLRTLIETKNLDSKAALQIVLQLCQALQYAHDEGVVHRDIKPGNILVDKRGRVKIADFGLAKLVDQTAADYSLTLSHQVMGTPNYMAPEQMSKPLEVDHRADIYSLGVVFYELLTGELPIGRFALPSKKVQIDVRLDEIVLRSLETSPEQRYQKVSDIQTDVESIAADGTQKAAKTNPVQNSPRFDKRIVLRPALLAFIVVLGAALLQTIWLQSKTYQAKKLLQEREAQWALIKDKAQVNAGALRNYHILRRQASMTDTFITNRFLWSHALSPIELTSGPLRFQFLEAKLKISNSPPAHVIIQNPELMGKYDAKHPGGHYRVLRRERVADSKNSQVDFPLTILTHGYIAEQPMLILQVKDYSANPLGNALDNIGQIIGVPTSEIIVRERQVKPSIDPKEPQSPFIPALIEVHFPPRIKIYE